MPTLFNEANIVCPFFKNTAKQSITCEGITDDSCLKSIFRNPQSMNVYRYVYCCSGVRYHECRVCKMLEEKYKEKESENDAGQS